jgi:hypothetical protein
MENSNWRDSMTKHTAAQPLDLDKLPRYYMGSMDMQQDPSGKYVRIDDVAALIAQARAARPTIEVQPGHAFIAPPGYEVKHVDAARLDTTASAAQPTEGPYMSTKPYERLFGAADTTASASGGRGCHWKDCPHGAECEHAATVIGDHTVLAELPDIFAKLREAYRRGSSEQGSDAGEYKAAEEIMRAWDLPDAPVATQQAAAEGCRCQQGQCCPICDPDVYQGAQQAAAKAPAAQADYRTVIANLASVVRGQNGNRHAYINELLAQAESCLAASPASTPEASQQAGNVIGDPLCANKHCLLHAEPGGEYCCNCEPDHAQATAVAATTSEDARDAVLEDVAKWHDQMCINTSGSRAAHVHHQSAKAIRAMRATQQEGGK